MKNLYVVATPIGNLKDISFRALEVLKEVDLILAEDTRQARKILSYYKIFKPLIRYDDNLKEKIYLKIEKYLEQNKNIALISDQGTPNISDPGWQLFKYLRKKFGYEIKIIPIPGPSALTCALSVCSINVSQFTFLGYPPRKKGRDKFFNDFKNIEIRPIIFFESVHRLIKTLFDLKEVFSFEQDIIILKELTKIYEDYFEGKIFEAISYFNNKEKLKGEFVIVIP